ncbi:cytochrome P450 [Acrocarpospora macrocephala]|uniref:Cytochrome P450 n=1 Tax=Acrocarpospora macrocephala TaxID=150177 RepID=A0A5M3WMH4_9ACTN|nr:cytochrome P450 [Acrocarpospora macrocephala]GES09836.1 cytochrome P450 [Acrocarpospora macrocephala]
MVPLIGGVLVVASLPYWVPRAVIALRMWIFARINGEEGIPVPGELVPIERFRQVYADPAANGRSHGAKLSDLFWYWLSPGAEIHQEHLEPGERYDEVARATRRFLSLPTADVTALAVRCAGRAQIRRSVRLRDLMMPVWAEFFYELVFAERCPRHARDLIVANADDVVTALKFCGLRHMDRRHRLTAYLETRLDDVRHPLPAGLTRHEQALYLQGTFFNTAVVQQSEASAHILMSLARHPHGDLAHIIEETFRLYPLFGIAHRVTSADITVDETTVLPAGSVLCFNYPAFHRAGFERPDEFDPSRWERLSVKHANHIPYGIAANRPCPAWRLSPIALRAAIAELLRRYRFHSTAAHTRSLPNRGPCLVLPRGSRPSPLALAFIRVRDRWEDVGRGLVQLCLGTYMVWDARRERLCERHFAASGHSRPTPASSSSEVTIHSLEPPGP